ncbi:hypothetical protein COO60DRAFT_329347 [Scenedesmus sp. NREL 46B-D3]|nr:hypothetical protein COO60DRAFT_329347 [Scenedesmus sp. NREL 46B-D3]
MHITRSAPPRRMHNVLHHPWHHPLLPQILGCCQGLQNEKQRCAVWLRFGSRWKHARQNGKGSCSGAGQCKQLLTSDVSMWVQPQTPRHTQFVGSVRRYQDTNIKKCCFLHKHVQLPAHTFMAPPSCCRTIWPTRTNMLQFQQEQEHTHTDAVTPCQLSTQSGARKFKRFANKEHPPIPMQPPVPLSHVSQGSFSTATCGEGKNKAAASMTAQ